MDRRMKSVWGETRTEKEVNTNLGKSHHQLAEVTGCIRDNVLLQICLVHWKTI